MEAVILFDWALLWLGILWVAMASVCIIAMLCHAVEWVGRKLFAKEGR